jgi:hypothetical protein
MSLSFEEIVERQGLVRSDDALIGFMHALFAPKESFAAITGQTMHGFERK